MVNTWLRAQLNVAMTCTLSVLMASTVSCATSSRGRPHEDQMAAWYHRIQVEEAKIDVAASALDRDLSQAERQKSLIALKDAAQRICNTAVLIGETDAELRCQMARRHSHAALATAQDDD